VWWLTFEHKSFATLLSSAIANWDVLFLVGRLALDPWSDVRRSIGDLQKNL
jgi:hypothetical protein